MAISGICTEFVSNPVIRSGTGAGNCSMLLTGGGWVLLRDLHLGEAGILDFRSIKNFVLSQSEAQLEFIKNIFA